MNREQIVHTFARRKPNRRMTRCLQGSRKTLTIPATSILFNIDQKADKSNASDALLYAFVRVFDEARGFNWQKNPFCR